MVSWCEYGDYIGFKDTLSNKFGLHKFKSLRFTGGF